MIQRRQGEHATKGLHDGTLSQVLGAAFRAIRKSPFLSAAIIVTLAIGIGANTAIFSVLEAVILRPLPFPDPGRLVMIWMDNRQQGLDQYYFSLPDYRDVKAAGDTLDVAAPHAFGIVNLTGVKPPQALLGAFVAPELLSVLGAKTVVGRWLIQTQPRLDATTS